MGQTTHYTETVTGECFIIRNDGKLKLVKKNNSLIAT